MRHIAAAIILLTSISADPAIAVPAAPAAVAVPAAAVPDLLWPLPYVEVTSPYGGRQHPITGEWRRHTGVDLPAHRGAPVSATGGGVVTFRGWLGGYGRMIRIDHGNGLETGYAHLDNWAEGLHIGLSVAQGDVIGYVGSSGAATGPHLHYEVKLEGKFIDPETTF